MRKIFVGLCFICLVYLGSDYVFNIKLPAWKEQTERFISESQKAPFTPEAWETLALQAESFPELYPFSLLRDSVLHVRNILTYSEQIRALGLPLDPEAKTLDLRAVENIFEKLKAIEGETLDLQRKLDQVPMALLDENQQVTYKKIAEKLKYSRVFFDQINRLDRVIQDLQRQNARVLLLLQNTNEPRSTGGFTGSLVMLNFDNAQRIVRYNFSDIYALDRLIPEDKKPDAPIFFHGLAPQISLRDANFFPHFSDSARQIQQFMVLAGERKPDTILALNLDALKPFLEIIDPIYLEQWDTELRSDNYAMILQFLVEAKVAGRYQVKEPVLQFAEQLLQKLSEVSPEKWTEIDFSALLAKKSLQGFSLHTPLQQLFEEWEIDGKFIPQAGSDNFLLPEFISVGANKSERFMWTKIYHESDIYPNGDVINSLWIKRTHTLERGELFSIFEGFSLPPNLQKLLRDKLLWVLGEGENRTILRLHVPAGAELLSFTSPSGAVVESDTTRRHIKTFDVPAFVLPAESLEIRLTYKTRIDRGSHNWRPYVMETRVPSGRDRTLFREIIKIQDQGKIVASTLNIGAPQNLSDDIFRAVIEWLPTKK